MTKQDKEILKVKKSVYSVKEDIEDLKEGVNTVQQANLDVLRNLVENVKGMQDYLVDYADSVTTKKSRIWNKLNVGMFGVVIGLLLGFLF